jgi:cytochrome c55X
MARSRPLIVLALLPLTGGALAGEVPDAARQAELRHLLLQDCGSCHGMSLKGGLGPSLLPAALAARSVEELAATIHDGRPGTPMAPWRIMMSRPEAGWLAGMLKDGLDARR